jgi:hypothetical protein
VFAGEGDRERAAAALKEHYVRGRLTPDELSDRAARVVAARSRSELRAALAGLPLPASPRELAAELPWARALARGAMLAVLTGAYLLFSFALVLVLALTLVVHGASGSTLLGFLVVWLVPTYLLSRLWHRGQPRRRDRSRRG